MNWGEALGDPPFSDQLLASEGGEVIVLVVLSLVSHQTLMEISKVSDIKRNIKLSVPEYKAKRHE